MASFVFRPHFCIAISPLSPAPITVGKPATWGWGVGGHITVLYCWLRLNVYTTLHNCTVQTCDDTAGEGGSLTTVPAFYSFIRCWNQTHAHFKFLNCVTPAYRPRIQELYNKTFPLGAAGAELTCRASGDPLPAITWRKWSRKYDIMNSYYRHLLNKLLYKLT
jgi:hypothetical protein